MRVCLCAESCEGSSNNPLRWQYLHCAVIPPAASSCRSAQEHPAASARRKGEHTIAPAMLITGPRTVPLVHIRLMTVNHQKAHRPWPKVDSRSLVPKDSNFSAWALCGVQRERCLSTQIEAPYHVLRSRSGKQHPRSHGVVQFC